MDYSKFKMPETGKAEVLGGSMFNGLPFISIYQSDKSKIKGATFEEHGMLYVSGETVTKDDLKKEFDGVVLYEQFYLEVNKEPDKGYQGRKDYIQIHTSDFYTGNEKKLAPKERGNKEDEKGLNMKAFK